MFTIAQLLADIPAGKTSVVSPRLNSYSGCNLLTSGKMRRGILYVAGEIPEEGAAEEGSGLVLVCRDINSRVRFPRWTGSAEIVLAESPAGADELFAQLQDAALARFEAEADTAQLAESIFHRRTVEFVIKQAAAELHNPVILTSSSYRVLAMETAGLEFTDPVWDAAMETGYCSADSVMHFETENVTRKVLKSKSAFVLDEGLAEKIPRILQKVEVRGKIGAYIGVFQVGRKFDERDLKKVDLICRTLSVILERDPKQIENSTQICQSVLSDLLNERILSATMLHERIRSAGWKPYNNFRCAVLLPESAEKGIPNADYIMRYLSGEIADARIIQHENGIAVLLNFAESGSRAPYDCVLRDVAEKHGLLIGISNEFRDLIKLAIYYRTAEESVRINRLLGNDRRVTYFCDIVFYSLAGRVSPAERTSCEQSKFKRLAEYDRQHRTEFCDTLKAYIECGCSSTLASQKLFIHRNTLTHRLEKLSEICGIDMNDGRELMHFYISETLARWDEIENRG